MMHRRDGAIDRWRAVPLFANCTPKQLVAIDSLSAQVSVKAGKAVAQQGTPGREFLVIVSGTASVERDGVARSRSPASSTTQAMAIAVTASSRASP